MSSTALHDLLVLASATGSQEMPPGVLPRVLAACPRRVRRFDAEIAAGDLLECVESNDRFLPAGVASADACTEEDVLNADTWVARDLLVGPSGGVSLSVKFGWDARHGHDVVTFNRWGGGTTRQTITMAGASGALLFATLRCLEGADDDHEAFTSF